MTDEDIQNLLGGFATDTLTDRERELLFTASLSNQELFNALADDQALRELLSDPAARRVRVLLGEVLLEQGKRSEAEPLLMTLVEEYNREAIDPKDGATLALVGRAAYLLGSPSDANDAFNEAERAGAKDADTLLFRVEVFLEGYDPGHADGWDFEPPRSPRPVSEVRLYGPRCDRVQDGTTVAHTVQSIVTCQDCGSGVECR